MVGNGQGIPIKSIGVTILPYPLNFRFQFTLSKLMFVPLITKNLLSVN